MGETLYLVDGSGFLFRAYHALPSLTTSEGLPTGAVYGLAQMLLRLEHEHRPSHIAVVFDAARRTFRNDLYAEYKAHRPPPPEELVPQFALSRRLVEALALPGLEAAGYEADDVIATLARAARERGMPVVIVSSDKDLMQLVGDGVTLLDTVKAVSFGPAEVEAKFGVPPERLGDVLALMGDASDNVPGVPGIGPKTAAALVQQLGSLEGVLGRVDEVAGRGAERVKALLREHADSARLSRRLVALEDRVPLAVGIDELRRRPLEPARAEPLFRELEFDKLLDRLRPAPAAAITPSDGGPRRVVLPDLPPRLITDEEELARLCGSLGATEQIGLELALGEGEPRRRPLVGLALATERQVLYVPVGHRYLGAPRQVDAGRALGILGPLLASSGTPKLVCGSKQAHVALAERGAALGGVVGDAELCSYLVDPQADHDLASVAERHAADVEEREALCGEGKKARPLDGLEVERVAAWAGRRALASLLLAPALEEDVARVGGGALLRDIELPLARVLAVIERHGVLLDAPHLRRLGDEVAEDLRRLEGEVRELAGYEVNIGSPRQLQELLFERLQLPPGKKTKTGFSTDAEVLEELADLHPIAAKIHEHRGLAKLKSTYIDALPGLVDGQTGRLHTSYNQTVAATGRLSSSEPNLQNIPIRSELGRKIRRAFVAAEGCRLVAADYSQIELRVLAHLSGDALLVDAFRRGQDVHLRTAAEVFGLSPDGVTAEQRRIAKAINFGIIYGQTDFGLSKVLGVHKAEAKDYIDGYLRRYSGVASYMGRLIRDARAAAGARTLLGRWRPLANLESSDRTKRQYAERMARNTPIQGTAADLLKLAMIRVQERLEREAPAARMLLTVHDELVLEVPEAEVERVGAMVAETMEGVWPLAVPLVVDLGSGPTWADC